MRCRQDRVHGAHGVGFSGRGPSLLLPTDFRDTHRAQTPIIIKLSRARAISEMDGNPPNDRAERIPCIAPGKGEAES